MRKPHDDLESQLNRGVIRTARDATNPDSINSLGRAVKRIGTDHGSLSYRLAIYGDHEAVKLSVSINIAADPGPC